MKIKSQKCSRLQGTNGKNDGKMPKKQKACLGAGIFEGKVDNMKNRIALLLAAALCLGVAACSPKTEPKETTQTLQKEETAIQEETIPQPIEVVGPWHLDSEKNDLAAFADSIDLFPGYGEWGASMEIRGNGQMSWYIGAEGWHGTYTLGNGVIHAQLTSDLEQSTRDWALPVAWENGKVLLEMPYGDRTIYWVYGDREDAAYGNEQ